MRASQLLFVLYVYLLISAVTADPIRGTIKSPFVDPPNKLSIVAYSRRGLIIDHAPVTSDASFVLHHLGSQDGDYVLHVVGSIAEDYHPQFVRIEKGSIVAVEICEDPLVLPNLEASDIEDKPTNLTFSPARKTNYTRAKRPWRLKDLWAYRIRLLQLAAIAFVVWFPQFIRSLPKDVRDELMDEKEEDLGDVTAVFRSLSGYKEPSSVQSALPTTSKR